MSDKVTVTAEDLVRAVINDEEFVLANQMGIDYKRWDTKTMEALSYWTIREIANHITLPDTITGTLNGQPARFEVVYRGD